MHRKHSFVLFIESKTSDMNDFKRLLNTHHLDHCVLVAALYNASYELKANEFNRL